MLKKGDKQSSLAEDGRAAKGGCGGLGVGSGEWIWKKRREGGFVKEPNCCLVPAQLAAGASPPRRSFLHLGAVPAKHTAVQCHAPPRTIISLQISDRLHGSRGGGGGVCGVVGVLVTTRLTFAKFLLL